MTSLSPAHLPDSFDEPDLTADDDLVDLTPPAPAGAAPTPGLSWPRRLARGYAAAPIAFTVALAVHASAIAAGLLYLAAHAAPAADRSEVPLIVLPYGWAADHDGQGTGDAGAALADARATPVTLRFPPPDDAAPADAEPSRHDFAQLPADLQRPDAPPPADSKLADAEGTIALGPLPALASEAPAAPIVARTPPGLAAAAESPTVESSADTASSNVGPAAAPDAASGSPASAGASAASPATPPSPVPSAGSPGTGTARAGAGPSDGGGPRGSLTGKVDAQAIPVYYPPVAFKQGLKGTAFVRFNVDARGRVRKIRIIESAGHRILDEEVVDGLNRWRPPKVLWDTVDDWTTFNFDPANVTPSTP